MQTRMSMWRWQHIFQNAVKSLLENIFQVLELPIVSNTFVVGIPSSTSNIANIEKIFFQSEDCGYTPKDFEQVFDLAKDNFDNDPEQFFFMGAAHLNQVHKDSLYPKALRKAVRSILKSYDVEQEWISFCSIPVQKNEHWVMTVIQLDRQDFDSQYWLTKKEYETPSMLKHRIDRCFLEALIYRVLKESELELQRLSEGNTKTLANSERVIEDAAFSLLKSLEIHINNGSNVDLLSFANAIAAQRYEGAASKGRLILCRQDHPDISVKIKLKTPIQIYNYRGIRKMLEVSSTQMALLCDCESVWGLGVSLNTYQPDLENQFEIKFTEYYTWELFHTDNIMLRVRYKQPSLPRPRFDEELFYAQIYELFGVNEVTANILGEAVKAALEQRHGTMLVITPEAEQEAARLSAQSTVIEPVMASQETISHVSGVDGAILISPQGIIYSFGVILDGKASKNGSSARGSRYNSAIRYVDGQKSRNINSLALIVSKDGYVDLYPGLKNES